MSAEIKSRSTSSSLPRPLRTRAAQSVGVRIAVRPLQPASTPIQEPNHRAQVRSLIAGDGRQGTDPIVADNPARATG